jgi:lipoprotein-anchoring transpeptidase ErfK/SrfK
MNISKSSKSKNRRKRNVLIPLILLLLAFVPVSLLCLQNNEKNLAKDIKKKPKSSKAIMKARISKIAITKSTFTMKVYDKADLLIKEYKIAVGKNSGDKQRKGDMRTPEGTFSVSQIQNSSSWKYDFPDDKLGPIPGAYGPWFIRLKTPKWTGIGIHGTHDPKSIGTNASTGCIRMYNKDIEELKNTVDIGTTVIIKN